MCSLDNVHAYFKTHHVSLNVYLVFLDYFVLYMDCVYSVTFINSIQLNINMLYLYSLYFYLL